jgi:hypothetical protein
MSWLSAGSLSVVENRNDFFGRRQRRHLVIPFSRKLIDSAAQPFLPRGGTLFAPLVPSQPICIDEADELGDENWNKVIKI